MTATAYPLSWPNGWKRQGGYQQAAFSRKVGHDTKPVTIPGAIQRLQEEINRLKADDVVLSCNLVRNIDGSIRGQQAEPADSGVAIYFKLAGKPTVLACDKWTRVADNMVAVAKHIEAMRGMDRWGVGSLAKAFAGYQALPSPEQWWQVLGVSPNATKVEIAEAYRRLAKADHPDQPNGSNAKMARLNAAKDQAESGAT